MKIKNKETTKIKIKLLKAGVSQKEIADHMSVTRSYINSVLMGNKVVSEEMYNKIIDAVDKLTSKG